MRFYLGTHLPHWLKDAGVPLFVSRRRLIRYAVLPEAAGRWALDSGGFTELSLHGEFTVTPAAYADEIRRYAETIGNLDWAAPQDWMCEPWILAKTGLDVAEHQRRTVRNYLELSDLLGHQRRLVVPVLQGWTLDDYRRCADLYEDYGVRLAQQRTVGLGSVCRRQATHEIGQIIDAMTDRGIRCHGFGVKADGIRLYGDQLESCDSMAWSFAGRKRGTCTHRKSRCANCRHYAMSWRADVLAARPRPRQMALEGIA